MAINGHDRGTRVWGMVGAREEWGDGLQRAFLCSPLDTPSLVDRTHKPQQVALAVLAEIEAPLGS